MSEPVSPLARTIDHVRTTGMPLVSISAAAQVTCGLDALSKNPGPIPLALLDEWSGLLNRIRVSRTPVSRFYQDGMPD